MKKFIFIMLAGLLMMGAVVVAGIVLADQNLVALHDSASSQYNPDCLTVGCHDTLLKEEKSLDPRVPAIHTKMIPYVPGYNPRKGVSSATCLHCHRSVDLINKSASALRKNVSPQICVVCHTSAGPGKALYK
ncbi:MAG: hypothetical protein ACE5OR_09030 [bacterium]